MHDAPRDKESHDAADKAFEAYLAGMMESESAEHLPTGPSLGAIKDDARPASAASKREKDLGKLDMTKSRRMNDANDWTGITRKRRIYKITSRRKIVPHDWKSKGNTLQRVMHHPKHAMHDWKRRENPRHGDGRPRRPQHVTYD